jgi:ABC-type branched-subunit amino acid transport system substrate-binding protein
MIQMLVRVLLLQLFLSAMVVHAEVRVGVVLPLSGGAAVWGIGIKRGLEVASVMHPGIFKLYFEDEGFCDSKRAVTAARKLIDIDSVEIIVTGCLNGTKAIGPLAKRAGVQLYSAGLLDQASLGRPSELVGLSAQIGSEAAFLADYLRAKRVKRLSVFRHDDTFTLEFHSQLRERLTPGTEVHDVAAADDSFPWASEILKARANGTDAFLVYLGDSELIGFMRARSQLKDSTPIVSGYMIESNFDPNKFGDLLTGIRYSYPALAADSDSQRRSFEDQFSQMFGSAERPSVNAYFVFDGMSALASAVSTCHAPNASCVWSHLRNGDASHRGASGDFRFLEDGSVERPFILKEVQGSTFMKVRNEG